MPFLRDSAIPLWLPDPTVAEAAIRVHKFGENSDVDAAEDIWDGGGNANAAGDYTYASTAETLGVSSDDDTDDQDVVVQGLDENWDLVTETITLTGQTKAESVNTFIRVYRAYNNSGTSIAGTVYIYDTSDSVVSGVPQTDTKIRAIFTPEHQQTMMALYSVPRNYTFFMTSVYASLTKLTTSAVADIILQKREFGKIFRHQEEWAIHSYSGLIVQPFEPPRICGAKTDIKLRCGSVSAVNSHIHAGFHGYLVPGTWE